RQFPVLSGEKPARRVCHTGIRENENHTLTSSLAGIRRFLARIRREVPAILATEDKRMGSRHEMNATLRLGWVMTIVATALAAIAAGSPLFS
ncbi:MAG TPA: hypothetical protein VFP63_05005, partial [Dehalococcoidia bacterium]|nr:hypothetical protein [Dehalococcoidia bacterium]